LLTSQTGIDPAIDGHKNTVTYEESHSVPQNKDTNPNGNFYEIRKTTVNESSGLDANPVDHRVFKIINPSKKNPHSGCQHRNCSRRQEVSRHNAHCSQITMYG
jgi:Cu2+-containing amine oxidase